MELFDLVRRLCDFDSTTGREGPVAAWLADHLEGRGWQVTRQAVEAERWNVYAHRGAPRVVLSTHLDTVPPYVPFREDATWLHGRGTCDAKGLAAAMVAAAEALVASGEPDVGLLFLVGEEHGSHGAKAAGALAPKGRCLINGEPTEGKLMIGQKGVLGVELLARGRAAHSGYPAEGESAIAALLDTLGHVRALPLPVHPVLGETTVNIGRIEGGIAPNVLAPLAEAHLLFRTVEETTRLRALVAGCAARGVEVAFPFELPCVESAPLPGWETTVVSYGSDLPLLEGWGERWQLGPGTIRLAHTLEERIGKAELVAGVDAYVRLARQLLARTAA